jgi:predicted nucleotidyltransferase
MELSANEKKLLRRYFVNRPIRRAYVFGSYARKTAVRKKSDLDILVELDYSQPIGMKFFGYQLELEELLNKKVDLVSATGLSKFVRPFVDKDKVLIYERGAAQFGIFAGQPHRTEK